MEMKARVEWLMNHTAKPGSHGGGRDSHGMRFDKFKVVSVTRIENVTAWKQYTVNREWLEDTMRKYDKMQNGVLEKEELKDYLTDLNGGLAPEDLGVDWVMTDFGGGTMPPWFSLAGA